MVDQLRGNYTVARCSNRWPLTVFYSMMNLVGINSQIIYFENTKTELSRKKFLINIAKELTKPLMVKRLKIPTISNFLRTSIRQIVNIKNKNVPIVVDKSRSLVAYCPKKKIARLPSFVPIAKILFVESIRVQCVLNVMKKMIQ